jgi:hypothetical protein
MTRENRGLEVLAAELRALMARARLDAQAADQFAQLVRRLEMEAQVPGALRAASPGVAATTQLAPPLPALQTPPVDPLLLEVPYEGYTREVKADLFDSMIEISGHLAVAPDEWLTVAARDNLPRDPLVPGDTADFSTVIFRVKGSDLAAFRGNRLSLAEAREKVEVREY